VTFGGGAYGGVPWGGAYGIIPSDCDILAFADDGPSPPSMPSLLVYPGVITTPYVPPGYSIPVTVPPLSSLSVTNAYITIPVAVPNVWSLEWTVTLNALPIDFLDIVNHHAYVGGADAAGPVAGLFISKAGVLYTGSVHFDTSTSPDEIVVDTATQLIPGSSAYLLEGDTVTFGLAVDGVTGTTYLYVTRTSDIPFTGPQLRAILPAIPASVSAGPVTDGATISVRGSSLVENIVFHEFCMSTKLLVANLPPVAISGSDQAIRTCSIVLLDGSASFDPEGANLLYDWRLIDAPTTSNFCIEFDDGITYTSAFPGFVVKFYSVVLGDINATEPIIPGDVLQYLGIAYTIIATGTDGNGFFVQIQNPLIPELLGNVNGKVLRNNSISGANTVAPGFYPDKPGFYKFDLIVFDGGLYSLPDTVVINVLESDLPRGCTPDLKFGFNYLSNFWGLVEDGEKISTFWSAIAQVATTELYTLWQLEYSKSLRDIQRTFARRWLHYDTLLPEPLPELSTLRIVWSGVLSDIIPTIGAGGVAGTSLEITSPLFAPVVIQFTHANPVPAEHIALVIRNALAQVTPLFTVDVIEIASSQIRISGPFPFTIGANSTIPVFTAGDTNSNPSGTGGLSINANSYRVESTLSALDIQEDDFLCLNGEAYRISKVVTHPSDPYPNQRVILKDQIPLVATANWTISGAVTSEFLDFYNGLVTKDDSVYFEVTGTDIDGNTISLIVGALALGANAALPGYLPFVPDTIGAYLVQNNVTVALAKVVRRTHIPVDALTVDVPTLHEGIVITDDQAVLRRNLDYFIEQKRGRNSIRFVTSLSGGPDVWETADPPNRLWAEYTHLDNRPLMEANFGKIAGFTLDDLSALDENADYLSIVQGLWYAYFNGPTLHNLRVGTQILLGLPFAEEDGVINEIRTDFSVTTGRFLVSDRSNLQIVRSYDFPKELAVETNPATGKPYVMGDSVVKFAPLTKGADVIDYVKDPRWFGGMLQQGIFYETDKFFKFLVRVDSAAFSLPTLLFVRNFILKIKPTYTYPFFLVRKEVGDTEVSITDVLHYKGTLRLEDNVCTMFDGLGSTCYDDPRASGGGYWNQFDSDGMGPPPVGPLSEIVPWGFDKNYLCPGDGATALEIETLAGLIPLPFDAPWAYDQNLQTDYQNLLIGPFVVPASPGLLILSDLSGYTGNLTKIHFIATFGPDARPIPGYELVVHINTVPQTPVAFVATFPDTTREFTIAVPVVPADLIEVYLRPSSGGPFSPAWAAIFIAVIADTGITPTFDYITPVGGIILALERTL